MKRTSLEGKNTGRSSFRSGSSLENTTTESDQCIYLPLLLPTSIRVLDLLPGPRDSPIRIEIRDVDLNLPSSFDYEALSYEWGLPQTTGPVQYGSWMLSAVILTDFVYCREKGIAVTKILYQLLKRLRKKEEARTLWIDAICINQRDEVEKGHQVQLMRRVYDSAKTVLFWLGDEAKGGHGNDIWKTEDAFALLPKLATAWKGLNIAEGQELEFLGQTGAEKPWNEGLLEKASKNGFEALKDLFTRSYFTRIWIVQEVVLACADSAMVLCGESKCTWNEFYYGYCFVLQSNFLETRNGQRLEEAGKFTKGSIWLKNLAKIKNEYMVDKRRTDGHPHGIEFHHLLPLIVHSLAIDPVDKIYGLLGLVRNYNPDGESLQPLYGATVEEVYTNAIEWSIRDTHSLIMLALCDSSWSKTFKNLPSWVPDVTSARKCVLVRDYTFQDAFDHQYRPPEITGQTLKTKALIFDTVETFLAPFTRPNAGQLLLDQFHVWSVDESPYPTGNSKLNAFFRTYTANKINDNSPAPPTFTQDFGYFFATFFLKSYFGLPLKLTGQEPSLQFLASTHPRLSVHFPVDIENNISILALIAKHEVLRLLYELLSISFRQGSNFHEGMLRADLTTDGDRGRQFFKTRKGYFGLGPPSPHAHGQPEYETDTDGKLSMVLKMDAGAGLRTHDVVAILASCPNVFILREEEERSGVYRIVGDSYVYGLTEGLCFDRDNLPDMQWVTIV